MPLFPFARPLLRPLSRLAAAAVVVGLLASCGGGSNAGTSPFDIGLPDADTLDQRCAMPRPGDARQPDTIGGCGRIDETILYQDCALPAARERPTGTPLEYSQLNSRYHGLGRTGELFHLPDAGGSRSRNRHFYGRLHAVLSSTARKGAVWPTRTAARSPAASAAGTAIWRWRRRRRRRQLDDPERRLSRHGARAAHLQHRDLGRRPRAT